VSDRSIIELVELPKVLVFPPRPRVKKHPSHQEFDLQLEADDPGTFRLIVRGSGELFESFSLVLLYQRAGLRGTPLLRVNGDHGYHTNPDGTRIECVPHMHMHTYGELLSAPADGHPEHAIPLPATINTPAQAWPIFREASHINDDPRMAKHLARVCGSYAVQLSLYEEDEEL